MTPSPPRPAGERVFGHLRLFRQAPLAFLESCARELGDVVHLRFLHKDVYLLSHPDHIERVFLTEHGRFEKSDTARGATSVFGNGLFNSRGELWQRQRQRLQQAFSAVSASRISELIVAETEAVIASWRPGVAFELCQEMSRLSLRIITQALFGPYGGPGYEQLSDPIEVCLERFRREFPLPQSPLCLLPLWVPTPANLQFKRARAGLREAASKLADAARRRTRDGSGAASLLDRFLNSDANTHPAQVIDEAVTLLLTGHDTSAAALAWTFLLLARHPEALQRVEEEVGRSPAATPVRDLPRTHAVIVESLRLRPPAWGTNRRVVADTDFGGFSIPKGATVAMSQWVVHRDPRFFHEPERFRPERWNDGREKDLPRFAFFPFGGGPRTCIGRQFAITELTLVVATIARRFRLMPMPPVDAVPSLSITMHPQRPVHVMPIPVKA